MRVLYWGTPDFATPPLRALLGEGFDVMGVVTQPDKAVGRSRSVLQPSPVKVVAQEEGLAIFQPEQPRGDEAFFEQVKAIAPDISVVVAYGHILPRALIDLPRLGTLNIHASLLPALRGAAPIQAAIAEGRAETGVTIMQMVSRLDAGPIVHVARTPILDDETAGELTLRLSELGSTALIEALALIELGIARAEPQDDALATFAPKLTRETAQVDFARSAHEVGRHVRAYDPKPGAWARLRGAESGEVKLFGARLAPRSPSHEAGEVIAVDSAGLLVACGEGAVRITAVQPSGKRRLTPAEWANGRGVAVGDRFDTSGVLRP
jgi:methionyl-tRNA formyltransferase